MNLQEIISFEGKRNCSFTLFVPENCLNKAIKQIEKKIFSIKHESKKKQLVNILNKIKQETKVYIQKHKDVIICCGLDNSQQIKFYKLDPYEKILIIEYFYDYKFHINKIYDFLYPNIKFVTDLKELNNWVKVLDNNELIVYENELNKFLELNLISDILYFSNDILSLDYVYKSTECNCKISIFSEISNNITQKYGKLIGILYFKIDNNNI